MARVRRSASGASSGASVVSSGRAATAAAPPLDSGSDLGAWLPLAALLAVAALVQILAIQGLAGLPSPLFGGDLYYQMGCVRSIQASGNPMASCSTSGALPGYLPLYGSLVALLSLVTGGDALRAMLLGSVLFTVAALFLLARIGGGLLARATPGDAPARVLASASGVGLAALWLSIHPSLIARYTDLAAAIVVPLFLAALWGYLEERTARRAALLGLALALCGYTHAVAFTGALAITALAWLLDLAFNRTGDSRNTRLGAALRHGAITAGLSLLSLGYWYGPLFRYGGRTSLHYTEWNGGPSLGLWPERLVYAGESLRALLRFDTPAQLVASIFFAIGLVALVRGPKTRAHSALAVIATATLAYGFHYLVTEPLLGFNLVPDYVRLLFWELLRVVIAALGLAAVLGTVLRDARVRWAAAAAFVLALAAAASAAALLGDPALARARAPLHPMYLSLQRYVTGHTRPDDVFLSSNELSFALSALTGRKVMTTRRAQNDAFIDMDARNRDAALILYGRDAERRRRLLAGYRVGYVLWTAEWPSTEFYRDERGNVTDYDDPLLYFENPAYDAELERAGVRFTHRTGWVDPTLRGPRYAKFPLTIVTPDNYARPDRPWVPNLDASLERVWSHEEGGQTVAALYRVR